MNGTAEIPTKVPALTNYNERILLAFISLVIALFGFLGNSLVILAVGLSRKLRTATNVYVLNLSVADLLVCLFLPWHMVALLNVDGWPLPDWICAVTAAVSIIFVGSSILTLACIALNRLYLITQPKDKYRSFYTLRNLLATTAFTWILPTLTVCLPLAFGIGSLGYDAQYTRCGPQHLTESDNLHDMIIASVLYPIPLVIIIYCYCKIFLHIRRHTKTMSAKISTANSEISGGSSSFPKSSNKPGPPSNNTSEPNLMANRTTAPPKPVSSIQKGLSKRQVEITKNLFYVVCAFILCLTPYSVGLMVPGSDHFVPYAGAILLLNSCINPVIYQVKHPYFRSTFSAILHCKFHDIQEPVPLLRAALSTRSSSPVPCK
ncbi:probable G-protein coupled receptor No18 [Amphiura filiformis]|uniref:probable G-protein coupled receptor No18 n=1 Tax=Amphiura filiformis TaxID=82378 RepID=UPI003B212F81